MKTTMPQYLFFMSDLSNFYSDPSGVNPIFSELGVLF